jgi:hypothetical protein
LVTSGVMPFAGEPASARIAKRFPRLPATLNGKRPVERMFHGP